MSKPRLVIEQYVKFKGVLNKYTGRTALRAPLRPITRLVPSPISVLLKVLPK